MNDLIGLTVMYTSSSNKDYEATIYNLPKNPYHAEDQLPTVSLAFRDERGKLKKKERVLHVGNGSLGKTQKWKFKKGDLGEPMYRIEKIKGKVIEFQQSKEP